VPLRVVQLIKPTNKTSKLGPPSGKQATSPNPFSPGEKGSRIQNPSPSGRGAGVRAEGHGKWIVIFMEYS